MHLTPDRPARFPSLATLRPPGPRGLLATLLGASLAAIFTLDRGTGAVPVQHLYYVPIVLAALWFDTSGALVVSLLAVALYHAANPHLLSLPYKDTDLVQVALFLAIGLTTARLAENARRLRKLAMTDDLTGLANLRAFEGALASLVGAARRTGRPLSLLVLDLDRLKAINDAHGHLAGAEAVRTVGQLLGERLPQPSVACRYGGDEFVVALPGRTSEQACRVADAIRLAVAAITPVLAGVPFPAATLSVSIGVACACPGPAADIGDEATAERLFRQADQALYRAKSCGRNRVSVLAAR